MADPVTKRKIKALPVVVFKRIQCDHEGRGDAGKRLKELYVGRLVGPTDRWLITNFSGAMVVVEGPYPFPPPTYEEEA